MIRTINGKDYNFKITRKGLRLAEQQGMNFNEMGDKPISLVYYLWYAALCAQYPMSFDKACDLLDTYLDSEDCQETFNTLLESLGEDFNEIFA